MDAPILPSNSSNEAVTTAESNPTVLPAAPPHPPDSVRTIIHNNSITKKKKKRVFITKEKGSSSSVSSSSSSSRVGLRRRRPKLVFAPARRGGGGGVELGSGEVEAIALPLGMSFAAVVAQVLERKDVSGEKLSVEHLSMVCTSAVHESLANVFGDKFNFFVKNFEKSFGSTLKTLRLINESSLNKSEDNLLDHGAESSARYVLVRDGIDCASYPTIRDCHLETEMHTTSIHDGIELPEEVDENMLTDCLNQDRVPHGQVNHLVCVPSSAGSVINQLTSFEKSVMEQTRSNDLKTVEIGLTMRKLKLKESQLALSFDSNHLERSKLAMGISKASFKAEKFKTQLEDTKKSELLKKGIDCLIAELLIMSCSLLYGTYVFSYERITEATASCSPVESKSSWFPKPFSSFDTGLNTLKCKIQVLTRMLFGILVILAIGFLLLQRSAAPHQMMPITFILLFLGVGCGLAGKICVDTLGGNGLQWLFYWETLCLLNFFSIVWPSILFHLLYSPVAVSQVVNRKIVCPYWLRRFLFYCIALVLLPLCCGLLPFAAPSQWGDHFLPSTVG